MSLLGELRKRNVLRVAAAYVVTSWLVVQVVETIFPAFGFGDAAIRNVVIALGIGFLPVLLLSWWFELTPEGLRKESEIDRSVPAAPGSERKLNRAITVVLLLAVAFFATDKFFLDPMRDAEQLERAREQAAEIALTESREANASIAVLPFTDMSAEGDRQYLSDGMAEELLNLLSRIPDLRVASRSSAFNLRDSGLSVPEMAEKLNVAHILEGSVRIAGDRIRVTAQLIDAETDSNLWSQTYDRGIDDVFSIQDNIAEEVVRELQVELLGGPATPTVNPKAYDLYLQARHRMTRDQRTAGQEITELLEQAVSIDPAFAMAWVSLSDNYQKQVTYGQLSKDEGLAKSRAALDMAGNLAPDAPEVWNQQALMAMKWDADLPKAAHYVQKLVDQEEEPLNKLAQASELMRYTELQDLRNLYCRHELKNSPTNADIHLCLAESYLALDNCERAYQHAQTTLTLIPDMWGAQGLLADALVCLGREEELQPILSELEQPGSTQATYSESKHIEQNDYPTEERLAARLDLPVPEELLSLEGACDTLQYKRENYCSD